MYVHLAVAKGRDSKPTHNAVNVYTLYWSLKPRPVGWIYNNLLCDSSGDHMFLVSPSFSWQYCCSSWISQVCIIAQWQVQGPTEYHQDHSEHAQELEDVPPENYD